MADVLYSLGEIKKKCKSSILWNYIFICVRWSLHHKSSYGIVYKVVGKRLFSFAAFGGLLLYTTTEEKRLIILK